ncbi:HepT-like ribonuclease domain-containing protein [Muribaculum intestinale]|uniref:HepT-like ribonuclease domain-containing protein n=1 Tax=Muribaculum intestinale TaxID=1796646 RepID=UPI0010935CF4|nr:HepT-like ribonuclease domain-containing protein [Muribaculum intestinale]TGX87676.1 DUF86 domain-containing protein [Muribaculum intestinale]
MAEQILKSLNDILKSVENIELFCSSRPKEFKTFCEDICFRSAVQWEIAIIGEAMNRILKISPNIQITSARRIVNTRNYLIHGYDSLREDLIWAIVINHLPLLKSEVTKLIESSQEVR